MKKGRITGLIAVAVVAGGGFLFAQLYVDREADRRIGHFLTKLPDGTKVKYRSAGYSLWNGKVRLRDVTVASKMAGEARIKGLTVASFDKFHRVPHFVTIKVRGFEMRREKALPKTQVWMDRLGYKTIVVDVDYVYRYRPDLRELTIERARISGPQVGTLELRGRFGNVKSLDARTMGDVIAIGMQAVLRDVRLVYTDASLTKRLIRAFAADAGESEAAARARLVKSIDMEMRATKSANLRRQMQHVRAFIAKPGKIVVTVKPRATVPMFLIATFRNPNMFQRMFKITVTALPGNGKAKVGKKKN